MSLISMYLLLSAYAGNQAVTPNILRVNIQLLDSRSAPHALHENLNVVEATQFYSF